MSDKVLIDRDLLKELVSSLEDEVESRYSNGIKEHPAIKRYYKCDIEPVIRGKELLAAAHAAPEADLSSHPLVAALCDLSYRAGLKAGWNYCADDDPDGFARSMETAREAVAVLNEHRQKGAPAAPEQVEHERKLFEARMRRVAPGVNLEMIGDRYNELDTQWKFELWLDRAAMAGKGEER